MKRCSTNIVLSLMLALTGGSLSAKPAQWWKWRSKIDGHLVCSQTPLGPGWLQEAGPFRDPRCEKLIVIR